MGPSTASRFTNEHSHSSPGKLYERSYIDRSKKNPNLFDEPNPPKASLWRNQFAKIINAPQIHFFFSVSKVCINSHLMVWKCIRGLRDMDF